MNLYRLELKRVCKTRMTAILLAIALVLAVVMAYLPVTFIGWTELDASGNEVRYTGLKAIRKRQEQQVSGTITPDVMQEALEAYQRVYRQYDASSINDIPVEVFYKELARYQPLGTTQRKPLPTRKPAWHRRDGADRRGYAELLQPAPQTAGIGDLAGTKRKARL